MLVLGADLHLFETVADVGGIEFIDPDGGGIIRLNRDHGDAAVFVVGRELRDAALVHLRDGTMIAGEDHDEHGAGRVVGELVNRSIDAGKFEVWRGRTEREDGMRLLGPRGERKEKERENSPRSSH